jgi:hypothetical protein
MMLKARETNASSDFSLVKVLLQNKEICLKVYSLN